MADQESGVSPTGQAAASKATGSFSTNGSDPGGMAAETDGYSGEQVGDGSTFLAELARAMQSTASAEQARNSEATEQRRQSHIDSIRAREAIEAEELRELAKEDVKGIDDWSDGEIKRIKLERERRIAARREQLQIRLEEHRTVVAQEVDAVEAAVASYRADTEQYFRRLESETDPVAIAKQAGTRPPFPVLELIGPNDIPATEARYTPTETAAPAEAASTGDRPSGDDQGSGPAAGSDTPMVPVIEAEPQAEPAAVPRVAAPEEQVAQEQAVQEQAVQELVVPEQVAQEPVVQEPVAQEPIDAVAATTGAGATEAQGGSEEPVGATAEARVVMPRSTGAGSWLRWPNSSADRSDPSQ